MGFVGHSQFNKIQSATTELNSYLTTSYDDVNSIKSETFCIPSQWVIDIFLIMVKRWLGTLIYTDAGESWLFKLARNIFLRCCSSYEQSSKDSQKSDYLSVVTRKQFYKMKLGKFEAIKDE